MNNKGFTFAELLAVIVILAIVSIIGVVSVGTVRNKMDKAIFETKLEHVVKSAETWGQNNKSSLNTNITVGQLITSGDLDTEEKIGNNLVVTDNSTGKNINGLQLYVYTEYNRVYACIIKNSNNASLLSEEGDYKKYSHLNYYC